MPPPIIAIHAAICLILDIQNVTFSLVIESNQILDSYNYVKYGTSWWSISKISVNFLFLL